MLSETKGFRFQVSGFSETMVHDWPCRFFIALPLRIQVNKYVMLKKVVSSGPTDVVN
jgi:hypothetical protein